MEIYEHEQVGLREETQQLGEKCKVISIIDTPFKVIPKKFHFAWSSKFTFKTITEQGVLLPYLRELEFFSR